MQLDLPRSCALYVGANHSKGLARGWTQIPPHHRNHHRQQKQHAMTSPIRAVQDDAQQAPPPERSFFQEVSGTKKAPWEIGRVQPAIKALVDAGELDGAVVMDVGCCIGDNTVYVAQHAKGTLVTGCDMVERALEVAREKAAEAGAAPSFRQLDLVAPLPGDEVGRYDVVLDSAVYHCFKPGSPDSDAYAANVQRLVKPGGRIVMLVFSTKQPGTDGPQRISESDIRASYPEPVWAVERMEDSAYDCNPEVFGGKAMAILAVLRKAA